MIEAPPFIVKIEGRAEMSFTPSEAVAMRDAVNWYFTRTERGPVRVICDPYEPPLQVQITLPDGL